MAIGGGTVVGATVGHCTMFGGNASSVGVQKTGSSRMFVPLVEGCCREKVSPGWHVRWEWEKGRLLSRRHLIVGPSRCCRRRCWPWGGSGERPSTQRRRRPNESRCREGQSQSEGRDRNERRVRHWSRRELEARSAKCHTS